MTRDPELELELQRVCEAHLEAIYEAEAAAEDPDDWLGELPTSPAVGPFCGCTTCIVREVLWAGWEKLMELAGEKI